MLRLSQFSGGNLLDLTFLWLRTWKVLSIIMLCKKRMIRHLKVKLRKSLGFMRTTLMKSVTTAFLSLPTTKMPKNLKSKVWMKMRMFYQKRRIYLNNFKTRLMWISLQARVKLALQEAVSSLASNLVLSAQFQLINILTFTQQEMNKNKRNLISLRLRAR